MITIRTSLIAALVATGAIVSTPAPAQQSYPSADAAIEALVAAARAGDGKQLMTIFGPDAAAILSSGDPVEDEETRKAFLAAYDDKHNIAREDGQPAVLLIGQDDFPFPIPLVEKNGTWSFDANAGREEILARRIGRNELAAIQVSLAFFDAENDYADMMPPVNGMSVYAQRVVSTAGRKDGLYWPASQGGPESPIGEAVADASQQGQKIGSGEPYHGYRYKILTRQGASAPGGAINYVVNGNMIGGFALVAWPAEYGNSGIATFMISERGVIYSKDLGPETSKIAAGMTAFNPDHTWMPIVETQNVQ